VRTAFGSSAPAERRAEKTIRTKNETPSLNDDLRPEYDLSKLTGGVRGKYYKRATAGTTLVLLEPDVAAAFPDGHTVNEALRALLKVTRVHAGGSRTSGKPPSKPLHPATRGKRSAKRRKT
jgi:hypothetical protein